MKPRHNLWGKAQDLRSNTTYVERLLWMHLRRAQVEGTKFRRQQPVENCIVDFLSFAPKVVIELDGSQHADSKFYDDARDACLRRNGFTVLRFWNNKVLENLEGVLETIRLTCLGAASPPDPLPQGAGEVNAGE